MKHSIPQAVLNKHTAVVGMTGSGKTSTSKLLIEQVAGSGSRVCILDPTKSDWWGLTSNKSGTGPGLPFQILGGPHGHVPLHAGAGAAIGELVATGKLPLSIIDMADFGPGGLQHFFNEFAPTLVKKMRGVLYLVIEEAHEFCPKEKSGVTGENMAVYYAKKLATAGRSKGVRLVVATQRVQALHNAVLSSCETVIVHRMTYPADQEPVTKWLKGSVKDRDVRLQIEESMPELADGEGWICSGSAKILERIQFARIQTFDNSATPEDDDHRTAVVTAKVDVEHLRAIIGDAVKDAEANDPGELKKRIRELEKEVAAKKPAAAPAVSKDEILIAEQRGFERGRNLWYEISSNSVQHDLVKSVEEIRDKCSAEIDRFNAAFQRTREAVKAEKFASVARLDKPVTVTILPQGKRAPATERALGQAVNAAVEIARGVVPVQQRVLDALAELEQLGAKTPNRELVAFMSGYTNLTSKGFRNAMSSLSTAGRIEYPSQGEVRLTDAGRQEANPAPRPRTSGELQARIVTMLGGASSRILSPLIDAYPDSLPRNDVAAQAGYGNMTSKGFRNAISRLRTLGFIDYPDKGTVVAAPVLFLEER